MNRRLRDLLTGVLGRSGNASYQLPAMLWRDEFTTDLAAGSVNGTAAEPGVETRVVTDTGNRMSISGGKLVWSGGASAYGDPGCRYTVSNHAKGQSIWAEVMFSVGGLFSFGYVRSDAPATRQEAFILESSLRFGPSKTVVGSYQVNDPIKFGVVRRAAGGYGFVKSADFPDWTLAYVLNTGTDINGAPAISNFSTAGNVEFIRRPLESIAVTPLTADTFNRADATTLGSTDGAELEETGGAVLAWTDRQGVWGIATNKAQASALDGTTAQAIATVPVGEADVLLEAVPTRAGNEVGLVAWWTDADNYVRMIHNGTNLQLIKRVAGNETTLVNAAATLAQMVLITDGTKLRCYCNNTLIGAEQTIADVTPTGVHGLFSTNTGNTLDTFVAWNRKGGAYSAFDAYFPG